MKRYRRSRAIGWGVIVAMRLVVSDAPLSSHEAHRGGDGEPQTILLSRAGGPEGATGNHDSEFPSLSADGSRVAFNSRASNLHPDKTDDLRDVLARDLDTHEMHLVSRASGVDGVKGNGVSGTIAISADGRYVVFYSHADNIHPDKTDTINDVFVRDLETHETILVSRASGVDGAKGNGPSGGGQGLLPSAASISPDGRYVAFHSVATNLHPDATVPSEINVFMRDLETHETLLISRASGPDGVKGNDWSQSPSITPDGRFVAFASFATNLHPDDTDPLLDVYIRDLENHETLLLSRASGIDGIKGDFDSFVFRSAISATGHRVAFWSVASNLHPDDTDTIADIFVRDLETHETILVSRAGGADGVKGDAASYTPAISADGRFVVFGSQAENIHPDKVDDVRDILMRDLATHETILVSRASGAQGEKGNSSSNAMSISTDGRFVAFDSFSTNLHPDAPDPRSQVYLRDTLEPPAGVVELTFDPSQLDFGDVEVGETSPPQSATLTNSGDADATGLTLSGLPDSGFAMVNSVCGAALPAGESCAVGLTFTPIAPGEATATLTAASAEGATADVELTGTGISGGDGFTPMALAVDPKAQISDGNGIFEPGERVTVVPTWRNDNDVAELLTGKASDFTGPEGADYTIPVPDADYGEVEPGANATCQAPKLCYQLDLGTGGTERPATHWMATFDETLNDVEGTTKTWSLHIGDSFTDVPRANPFYPSIETLLHGGITGGCTATEYCPAGANARGQMAVFLLRAAEGAGYQPPACVEGEEEFDDVPADSTFCPWIEELAGRGITSGCDDGNYCPTDSVTRAQMAVFLLRAVEGGGYTPPPCSGVFVDVECPSTFAAWIEELAERGITAGCAEGRYCPNDAVTRGQMAVFVSKAFGLTLYRP